MKTKGYWRGHSGRDNSSVKNCKEEFLKDSNRRFYLICHVNIIVMKEVLFFYQHNQLFMYNEIILTISTCENPNKNSSDNNSPIYTYMIIIMTSLNNIIMAVSTVTMALQGEWRNSDFECRLICASLHLKCSPRNM